MNKKITYDLTKFFTGPDLLLKNAFRLAEMPVDTIERNLNKRQQMIDLAVKMGMPLPQGRSPIFAVSDENGHDGDPSLGPHLPERNRSRRNLYHRQRLRYFVGELESPFS